MGDWSQRWGFVIIAGLFNAACLVSLSWWHQQGTALLFWIAGVLLAGFYFFKSDGDCWRVKLCRSDLLAILTLIVLFAPLYLANPELGCGYYSREECVMLRAARTLSASNDVFGLFASWWDFPNFDFWLPAQIAKVFFGSISVINLRLVEGLCGLVFVSVSFVFLRLALPLYAALGAATMLGSQQVVLSYARMGKWEIHILVTEVAALAVLYLSLKKSSRFLAYLGGAISGFGFMESPPAQAIIPLWLTFPLVRTLVNRSWAAERKTLSIIVLISLFGALQIGLPTLSQSLFAEGGKTYRWTRVLYSPAGLALEKQLAYTSSAAQAIQTNMIEGLTCFNSHTIDSWGQLTCPAQTFGFLDPISGLLLWLGIALAVRQVKCRQNVDFDLLALSSFTLIWLSLSFVFNGAPVYGRLMVALPFVYYFVALACNQLAFLLINRNRNNVLLQSQIVFIIVIAIAMWNLYELGLYLKWQTSNDSFSAMVTAVEERKDIQPYAFYAMYLSDNPFRSDDSPGVLADEIQLFTQPKQSVAVFKVTENETAEQDLKLLAAPSFTLFLPQTMWTKIGVSLMQRYPHQRLSQITSSQPDNVFEVDVSDK